MFTDKPVYPKMLVVELQDFFSQSRTFLYGRTKLCQEVPVTFTFVLLYLQENCIRGLREHQQSSGGGGGGICQVQLPIHHQPEK